MTYSLDSAYTATLWEAAIIEVEYTISSIVYKAKFLFDVVLNKLKCNVIDADLKNHFPALADEIWSVQNNYDKQKTFTIYVSSDQERQFLDFILSPAKYRPQSLDHLIELYNSLTKSKY